MATISRLVEAPVGDGDMQLVSHVSSEIPFYGEDKALLGSVPKRKGSEQWQHLRLVHRAPHARRYIVTDYGSCMV